MSTQDNAAPDAQHPADEAEEDRLFYEVAGEGPAGPAEPGPAEPGNDDLDETGDPPGDDGTPRDDQGRYASGDGNQDDDGQEGQGDGQEDGDQGRQETADQELERLRQEAQQWQHRYQSDLGRQSALQRKIQQLEDENRQLQQSRQQPAGQGQGRGQEGEGNPEGSGMSDEDWKTLKADFPEIAKGIEQQLAHVTQRYESQLNELKSQITPIQERAAEQESQAERSTLEELHPGWQDTVKTPDFINWLNQLPEDVQKLKMSDKAADAAFLLDSYKAIHAPAKPDTPPPTDQRARRNQRRLQSAQSVPSRGGRQRSDIPEGDEDALFDYFANKVDQ